MSKLRYFYGTMASAKSSNLLMKVYQFEQSGSRCLLLKPSIDTRVKNKIYSRIVPSRSCKTIDVADDICEIVFKENKWLDCLFIDEVQFLTEEHVKQLWTLAHKYNIDVYCYGLKLDYKNELFPASKQLLILADTVEEIKSRCCHCVKKATTHLRYVSGKVVKSGESIHIDKINPSDEKYESVCQDCWNRIK